MQEVKSSFRDPSGQVYQDGKEVIRLVYPSYYAEYKKLMAGPYRELVEAKLLIPHEEIHEGIMDHIAIQPEFIPFISYPYEWCFSMLKEAALTTLKINRIALDKGMMLKDASAYNMQYHKGKMVLIDTLSFMTYQEGMPWGSYRQFLQHFLYPLLLMAHYNPYMGRLSQIHLDGIPAGIAAKLLPWHLKLKLSLWAHLYAQNIKLTVNGQRNIKMSRYALLALLDNLESTVRDIKHKGISDWMRYEDARSYTDEALRHKEDILDSTFEAIPLGTVSDLGANTGWYSYSAALIGHKVIAIDSDHDCIEHIYQHKIGLPLIVNLCNPSPAIGFDNTERKSFLDRLHVDTIMALALIHHLCVGNNVPLGRVAEMLAGHCKNLIIEFIPLDDPKAQLLLGTKNIPPYSLDIFKAEFGKWFVIKQDYPISDSLRSIYLMEKR